MIVDSTENLLHESVAYDESDLCCYECGKSIMTRFGIGVPHGVCPSCQDEFDRLNQAGKLIIYERE